MNTEKLGISAAFYGWERLA